MQCFEVSDSMGKIEVSIPFHAIDYVKRDGKGTVVVTRNGHVTNLLNIPLEKVCEAMLEANDAKF